MLDSDLRDQIIRILLASRVHNGRTDIDAPRYYHITTEFAPQIADEILALVETVMTHKHSHIDVDKYYNESP